LFVVLDLERLVTPDDHPLRPMGMETGYDDGTFLAALETQGIIPHLPLRSGRIVTQDEAGQARQRQRGNATNGNAAMRRANVLSKRAEEIAGASRCAGLSAGAKRWAD
jgi:hypothetical protein